MNRLSEKILAVALLLGSGESAFATDLLTIYREARTQHSTYAGAKAQYIGSQERLPQARALLLPSVHLGSAHHYNAVTADYPTSPGLVSGHFNFYDYNYGGNVAQPLYRRQNDATYEQAKVQVRQ